MCGSNSGKKGLKKDNFQLVFNPQSCFLNSNLALQLLTFKSRFSDPSPCPGWEAGDPVGCRGGDANPWKALCRGMDEVLLGSPGPG